MNWRIYRDGHLLHSAGVTYHTRGDALTAAFDPSLGDPMTQKEFEALDRQHRNVAGWAAITYDRWTIRPDDR